MPKFKYFLNDSFWIMTSQFFATFANLALVYILANMLSTNNYGEFKLVTTWLGIALGIGYTGYTYTLPQKIARNEKYSLRDILRNTFIYSLPTFVTLFCISIYYLIDQNINLSVGFFFSSIVAPILCTSLIVNLYYQGHRNFKNYALSQIFVDIFQLSAISFFAYYYNNFILIISAYFVATIFANILIILKILKEEKTKERNIENQETSEEILAETSEKKYQNKLNLATIFSTFSYQIDKLLIFHFIGATPLAIYSIVSAVSDQAKAPIKSILVAVLPRMTNSNFTKQKLFYIFIVLAFTCFIIFAFVIFANPFVFQYVFPKYSEYIYLANLSALGILFAPSQLFLLYLQAKNDFNSINNYYYLITFVQVSFFTLATFFASIFIFLVVKNIIGLIGLIYLAFKVYKN